MDDKLHKNIRDIFVKLKNVFTKDLYIIKNKFVCAGKESSSEKAGTYMCILEPKYSELLDYILDKDKSYYIKEVDIFKEDFTSGLKELDDYDELQAFIENTINEFNQDLIWIPASEQPDLVETIFDNKKNYELIVNDISFIIGKPLLPVITKKNITNLMFNAEYDNDLELNVLRMDFRFTHFQLLMKYYALKL